MNVWYFAAVHAVYMRITTQTHTHVWGGLSDCVFRLSLTTAEQLLGRNTKLTKGIWCKNNVLNSSQIPREGPAVILPLNSAAIEDTHT